VEGNRLQHPFQRMQTKAGELGIVNDPEAL
jgi:hypothetical protein